MDDIYNSRDKEKNSSFVNRRTLLKGMGVSLALPFMNSVSAANKSAKPLNGGPARLCKVIDEAKKTRDVKAE